MTLRVVGGRIGVAFTQDFGDELRDGEHRVALAEQEMAAEPGAGAFGQVPAEHDLGARAREPRRQDGRPVIVAVAGVENLDALLPHEPRGVKDQRQFEQADRRRLKRQAQLPGDGRKLTSFRSYQPHGVAELMKRMGDADRAVVRPAAAQ